MYTGLFTTWLEANNDEEAESKLSSILDRMRDESTTFEVRGVYKEKKIAEEEQPRPDWTIRNLKLIEGFDLGAREKESARIALKNLLDPRAKRFNLVIFYLLKFMKLWRSIDNLNFSK
jgi:hypothetical protein